MPESTFTETADSVLTHLRTLPRGAVVLTLGGTDHGKTTWVRDTAQALTAAGLSVAVVDCDIGQSEIGPPGTVGAALAAAGAEWKSLRDLTPLGGYFVGAVSPVRQILTVCTGAVAMARVAKRAKPDLVLVDTDGLVTGGAARAYKKKLAELLLPQAVVALTRGSELDPLLALFSHLDAPDIWRVPVPAEARRKTPATRTTRRAARFLSALEGARSQTFSLDEVALANTGFGVGEPVPHHLARFLGETLGRPVLHAAQTGDSGLYVVVNGDGWRTAELASIEREFGTRSITVVPAQRFARLLVGLVAASGALLDIGLIERIDFAARTLTVQTPCTRPRAVAQVWLGALRLHADGREIGEVRPGDL